MPVVALCPRCRAVLSGTGGPEHCPKCGENVVGVPRALCSRCGKDVTTETHIRPSPTLVYCEPCWVEVRETAGQPLVYPCSRCGKWFPPDHIYSRGTGYICPACHAATRAEKEFDPNSLLVIAEEAAAGEPDQFQPPPESFRAFRSRIWWAQWGGTFIRAGVVLGVAFVLFLAWMWFSRH